MMAEPNQLVHIRLSKELLVFVDDACRRAEQRRNEFIRQAIAEKLRQTVPNAFPTGDGVNILMTDDQIDDTVNALRAEKHRRYIRRHYG